MADGINFGLLGVGETSPYQQARQRDVQNQLVQQQLTTGQMQQESARMSLAQAKKDQEALAKLQQVFVANGKSPDLGTNFRAMVESGISHYVDIGMKGLQMLEGQRRFRELIGGGAEASAQGAPRPSDALSQTYAVPDTMPNELAASAAPAAAAPAAPPKNKLVDMENKIAAAYEIGTPASIAWAQAREKELSELRKPQVVAPGASVYQGGESVFTAPEKSPTKPEIVREYEYAKENGYKGSLFDFKREIAAAGRQAPAPAAPSTTEVVDPTNPKQMLKIDAKVYRGGGLGSPGVIGLAGKEPKAAQAEEKQAQGRENVDLMIAQLRSNYGRLNEMGAITSKSNRAGTNIMAGLGSSGFGQATGRVFGTEAQSERNQIAQTRPLLLQAIKEATGMSAKQMDSNVELKMYLAAATDPSLDFESNMKALDNLEKLIGSGKLNTGASKAETPKANAPKTMSAEDKQALDWANANPKDPRAAKIKQRLGQ